MPMGKPWKYWSKKLLSDLSKPPGKVTVCMHEWDLVHTDDILREKTYKCKKCKNVISEHY